MTEADVLDLFRHSGALLEGHFRLSSGLHSDRYLQSALVLQHPDYAEQMGRALAARLEHLQPTVILSPALGGIVIGQEVGRALGVRAIFAERQDGKLTLRRGLSLDAGERVLVVEDVVTTGGSTRETMEVARAAGRQADAAARLHPVAQRSRRRGRGRHHDRRIDARDDRRGGRGRRERDGRGGDHRSRRRSRPPQRAAAGARAHGGRGLSGGVVPDVREGDTGHQAWFPRVGRGCRGGRPRNTRNTRNA